jgi:hypothetical protein
VSIRVTNNPTAFLKLFSGCDHRQPVLRCQKIYEIGRVGTYFDHFWPLPAFIASRRSRFITRYESAAAAATPQALAESVRAERGGDI